MVLGKQLGRGWLTAVLFSTEMPACREEQEERAAAVLAPGMTGGQRASENVAGIHTVTLNCTPEVGKDVELVTACHWQSPTWRLGAGVREPGVPGSNPGSVGSSPSSCKQI